MINEEVKYRLSFLDYKTLLDYILSEYGLNLSNFAHSITKRRIEDFLAQYRVSSYNSAISVLEKKKNWELLLDSINVPITELFRDSEFWIKLKNKIIPKLKIKDELKIWVPDISTGEELMSLLIVLNEASLENNFEIIASSPFETKNEFGTSLLIDEKKMNISTSNYIEYNTTKKLDSYFVNSNSSFFLKKDFLINVKFKKFVFEKDIMPASYFDIVLFRNRLIYYNQNGQKKALDSIYRSMKNKGYLFLGLKENFGDWKNKNRFSRFEKECNIFMKKK